MNTSTAPKRRLPPPRPLADMIGAALSPVLAAKGFAGREVISGWAMIVGERLAKRSRPLKIDWPRQRPGSDGEASDPATLVVLVESAFAPELQHAAPVLMARINAHLGWPAVGKVVLRQGPVQLARMQPPPAAPLPDQTIHAVTAATAPITEAALRDAMTRLGLAIAGKARRS